MSKLYYCYDKVSETYKFPMFCETDSEYVRFLVSRSPILPSECDLYSMSCFDPCAAGVKAVDWSCYKLPESAMKAFAPMNVSESDLSAAVKAVKSKSEVK